MPTPHFASSTSDTSPDLTRGSAVGAEASSAARPAHVPLAALPPVEAVQLWEGEGGFVAPPKENL